MNWQLISIISRLPHLHKVVTDLCIFLVEKMVVRVGHEQFFQAKSCIVVVMLGQVKVTQFIPGLVVCHKTAQVRGKNKPTSYSSLSH